MLNILDHEVIPELQREGIPFTVLGENEIRLEGFGKSSFLWLKYAADPEKPGSLCLTGHSRYNRLVPIEDLSDIISEAWYWYKVTCERNPTANPVDLIPLEWKGYFIKFGYISVETKTIEVVTVIR